MHKRPADIRAKLASLAMHMEDNAVALNAIVDALQHPEAGDGPEMAEFIADLPRIIELRDNIGRARDAIKSYRCVAAPFDQ